MLRTTPRRRPGRPFGPAPTFLADCLRFDATALLARSRGARVLAWETATADLRSHWTLQWTEDGRRQSRIVELRVTTSRQHLGGGRRWWRCPACHRRCRLLVATDPRAPIGCRICLHARYAADYPARDRRRRFVALFHALGAGRLDVEDEELDLLLAPRRRGVRRGRRIYPRAARAVIRLRARCQALPDILQTGGLP